MDYNIVYVFNGKKWLWRQLMLSIKSLQRFVTENIVVFYGPPRFDEHIEWLESMNCDVRLVETPLDNPDFIKERKFPPGGGFYGVPMKLHAYGVEVSNMVHLDCDTVIIGNLLEVFLWKDYDMAIGKWHDDRSEEIMKNNLEMLGLPHWPMMMDGFVACKHNTHNKFLPIYKEYLVRVLKDEIHPHSDTNMNVHAYNLTLGQMRKNGYNIEKMPIGWHSYGGAKYVKHLPHKHFELSFEKELFTEKEHKLKEIGA